jgi:D-aspartate ligase
MHERVYIVIGIEHYNPLGIIRSLGESGIRPVFIAIPGRVPVASCSKYVAKLHTVNDFREGCKLLLHEYGNYSDDNLPIVITSEDEILGYMDENYDDYAGKFIFFNAGKAGQITKYMNKYTILEFAKEHGLKVLESKAVPRGVIPDDIPYPVITKSIASNVGGWKADVFICQNEEELKRAYEKIQSPTVLVQHYLDKKNELAIEGYTVDCGRQIFLSTAHNWVYNIAGYYSPYHYAKNFTDEKLIEIFRQMFSEIGFEGIFEIEFLIDKDDTLYFSEINFRVSAWIYASTCVGNSMLTGKIPEDAYKVIPKGFTSMCEPIDYQKRVIERGYPREKWYQDFMNANCKYYFNKDDLMPFFIMLENNERLR